MWIVPSLLLIGFVEYAGHRWLLHKKTVSVGRDHLNHHKTFTKYFIGPEPVDWYDYVPIRMAMALLWSGLGMLPVCLYLDLEAGLTFVSVAVLHAGIWHWVHGQMHRPTCGWLTESGYFQRIRDFHVIHHKYPRTNYAFLFAPLYDVLFRTYRRHHGDV